MKNISWITTTTLFLIGTIISSAQAVEPGLSDMENANRAVAREFYDALYRSNNQGAMKYLHRDYIEHQISANYSAGGLLKYASNRVNTYKEHYNVIHRTIAQDNMVFLHVEERLTPTQSVARGELFRFSDQGMIEEHWGVEQQAIPLDNNTNGFFLGSEVNRSSDSGRRHAVAIMDNDAALFRNLDTDLIFATRTSRYIQHNQWSPNGPEGLRGFIESMKADNVSVEVKVKHIVAEGDYIVGLNYFKTTPAVEGFSEVVVFDLIRVTDEGKSDEHWDVIQELNGEPLEKVF